MNTTSNSDNNTAPSSTGAAGSLLLILSGIGLIAAAVMWLAPSCRSVAAVMFAVSALVFTFVQQSQQQPSSDVVLRRLHRQQTLGGLAYIVAGMLMCSQHWHLMYWCQHNEWMVAFAIGCVLQLYTAFRIPAVSVICLLLLTSCQDTYRIEGTTSISALEGETLYLKVFEGAKPVCLDSCLVRHGNFSFHGTRDSVEMALIYYQDQNLMPVMLDATSIQVELSDAAHRASGSELNDSLFRFIETKAKMDRALEDIPGRLSQLIMDGYDIDEVQPMLAIEAEQLKEVCDRAIIDFIKKNINNPMGSGVFMLVTLDNPYPTLSPEVEEILTDAGAKFRGNGYVHKYIETAEENMLLMREGKKPVKM